MWRWAIGVLVAAALDVGVTPAADMRPCPLLSEQPMIRAELFFGLSVPGRGPVSDAEWRRFAARVLSRYFPDGFTAYGGDGQWKDPRTGRVVKETSKVVLVVGRDGAAFTQGITAVADTYKREFKQQSVGIVTQSVCAAF